MPKHRATTQTVEKDERGTPAYLFDPLHRSEKFSIDVAASHQNAKLPCYYTKEQNGLAQSWEGERVWCNPPFSNIRPWVQKAIDSNCYSVFLLPASTDTSWFHDLVLVYGSIEWLRGRLKFEGFSDYAPFGCMIVRFRDTP